MTDFKKSVVYQIYPKSFYDSNGDGLGDLKGVTEKLPYLQRLGVDVLWLTPFYVSPQRDNGYDVADYCQIDPRFGSMEDFQGLVAKAKEMGMEVMLDMVFNHSSDAHPWFQKALGGDPCYQDFYIFKKGSKEKPPTNWLSKFGGSAWAYVEALGAYYLHLFDVSQPDLNWDNPRLRNAIYQVVNFWIDQGVRGFRLDVVNLISKPQEFLDDPEEDGRRFYTDGPQIHTFLKELNRETFGKHPNMITVGEMSSTTIDNCIKYSNPDEKELSMVFNFHHLKVDYRDGDKWSLMDFDFLALKNILNDWQVGMEQGNGWNAVFWCNHDQPRVVSRFGNDRQYHRESAKMLATAIHLLRGTPYIYQGEELGMTNPYFSRLEEYNDVESINHYHILRKQGKGEKEVMEILQRKSRDNSRTPMHWNDGPNGGFTEGIPWLAVAKNYREINAKKALEDADSVFYHYQKLISLRRELEIIAYGGYRPILANHPEIYAYIRAYQGNLLLVINNFYDKAPRISLPQAIKLNNYHTQVLISNYPASPDLQRKITLRPYESIAYYLEKKR